MWDKDMYTPSALTLTHPNPNPNPNPDPSPNLTLTPTPTPTLTLTRYTPDEQLAGTVVTLPDGMRSGVIKVRLPGCIAGADVEELRFAFELIAEAEVC